MNMNTPILVAALAAFSATAFAQSAAPASAQNAATTHYLCTSSKLLGTSVRNESDKNLGELGDLLVDPRTGEIRYAVLEVGGILGVGEDRRVVPWSFIHVSADEKDAAKCHARTNLTEAQVKAAPKSKSGQKFDAELDRRIEATFGKDDAWAYVGKGQPMFTWFTQMDGALLADKSGKEIGKIEELIVAPQNGCIAYVVIDTAKDAGDKEIAVPFAMTQFAYDKNDMLAASTSIDTERLKAAPEYDAKDWKRMSSTAWMNELSTYYVCDPFWKNTRFASARKLPQQGS